MCERTTKTDKECFVNAGDEFFEKKMYADAIKQYAEAIKRNPEDPKVSNHFVIHMFLRFDFIF